MRDHDSWRIPSFVLILLLLVLAAPAWASSRTNPDGGTGGSPIDGLLQVTVIYAETGAPVDGAFVMAGSSEGVPFPGNWGWTDPAGVITFSDPALQGPIEVTAGLAGYQYFTLVQVDADDLVLPLEPISVSATTYEIGDYVNGVDVDNGVFNFGDGFVDMAFVVQTLDLDFLLSFDVASLMGPLEQMVILGETVDIPANMFVPQQWEIFIEINKDHYYLYLEPGDHTLYSMSGRVDRQAMIDIISGGGEIVDVLPLVSWRECDLLDVSVSGDLYSADPTVDPDMAYSATVSYSNVPEGTNLYGISAGDLEDLHGLGRIVPLGFSSVECPSGGGDCSGSLSLSTVAAIGDFSGMGYFPAVVVESTVTDDFLAILHRGAHSQTYSDSVSEFFQWLDLDYTALAYSWNDVEDPGTASPAVDLHYSRIISTDYSETYWKFLIPGSTLSMIAPVLPAGAPPGPTSGSQYGWEHSSLALNWNLLTFDFDDFAFSQIPASASHLALDIAPITFQVPSPSPTPTATATSTFPPVPATGPAGLALLIGLLAIGLAGRRRRA